jgi:hypothetical protein
MSFKLTDHQHLMQGAEFEGRSRRPSDPSELDLVVDARAAIDANVA